MTDNARIDEKLDLDALNAAIVAWKSPRVHDSVEGNTEAAIVAYLDTLARRSIQEQPEAVAWMAPDEGNMTFVTSIVATAERWRREGRDVKPLFASAPPPIAGAGWKPAAEFAPPDDDYWQMAVREIERAGKGLHHAHLTNHHAATLLYWANLARDAYRASPVPDNTDARAARVKADWRCAKCDCHSFARIDRLSDGGKRAFEPGDFVRCVNCKDTSYFPRSAEAGIIPGTDASGVIEQLREALGKFIPDYVPWMDSHNDDTPLSLYRTGNTFGDLRRAHAALDPVKAPKP